MNSKTKAFFVITLAAILSVSLVTAGSIQPAAADKDKDHDKPKKTKFDKKPRFVSESCIVTADDLPKDIRPSSEFTDGLDCKMEAWLDKKGKPSSMKSK